MIPARKAVIDRGGGSSGQIEPNCPIADLSLMLEVVIEKRRRSTWEGRVLGLSGRNIMSGREKTAQRPSTRASGRCLYYWVISNAAMKMPAETNR
jgi:hypothetical protein